MTMFYDLTEDMQVFLMIFINHTKQEDVEGLDYGTFYELYRSTTSRPAAIRRLYFQKQLGELLDNCILVKSSFRSADGVREEYRIHIDFFDDAIELYGGTKRTDTTDIPASDRFVSVSDNQPELICAVSALENLSEAVRSANDLTANSDDRIQLSKEVDAIKDLISQPRIHVVALYDAVNSNRTLKWLAEQTISGVVRTAAGKVFEYLITLLHMLHK